MAGIIKLGLPGGTLYDYSVEAAGEGIQWERTPASPFAATVNSSGPYDRVDLWNEYTWEDWQTGVGRVDPEAGGFLYAEAETRVPSQVILPPLVQQCDTRTITGVLADCRYMPTTTTGSIIVGTGGYTRAAISFTTPGSIPATRAAYYFYARIPNGTSVTISTYTNSSGSPNTLINSVTVTGESPDRNFYWYGGNITHGTLTTSTQYWLVIHPTSASDAIDVAYGSTGYNTLAQSYNGSVWANITSTYLLYTTNLHTLGNSEGAARHFARFNSILYHCEDETLYKYDSVNEQFDSVGTVTGTDDVTSMVVFGPTLFFGRSSGNYTTMNTSEVFAGAATTRKLFALHNDRLYGSWGNNLYYTDDGSTWSAAFAVGGSDSEIRGMAGMGDSLYMATDKSLWRFAPGEVVEFVTNFGAEDSNNGKGMIEYQGRLYIPAHGRIFRFDPSGQMMDIWINYEDDLPVARIGQISHLVRMNNWLVAYAVPAGLATRPSLWMWQEEGWHFVACAPQTAAISPDIDLNVTYYDRGTSRLWFSNEGGCPFFVDIDDYTLNPYNVSGYLYQPYGWIEQDRFWGGNKLLPKNWESVTISGDNLSSGVHVKVYWQDEGSTAWELLGTADTDGEELRWNNYSTRPTGKWVKLGLLLQSNDGDETPRLRAATIKFYPVPNGRIRDNLILSLGDYVEFPDRTKDSRTLAQQITHLESLVSTSNPIVAIYQDPFGTQHEVAIPSWNMTAPRYDVKSSAGAIQQVRARLVVERITASTYTP